MFFVCSGIQLNDTGEPLNYMHIGTPIWWIAHRPQVGSPMYKIFMIITLPVLALAWLAYYLWQRHLDELEKNQPKKSSRLEKSRGEVADWAAKMASYKPPKRPSGGSEGGGQDAS